MEKLPIRFSTWTVMEGKKKREVDDIMVKGYHEHIPQIAASKLYLSRLYGEVYGKDKWKKYYEKNTLRVLRIVLKDTIHGLSQVGIDG
jgi:hypothetical protein